MVTPYDFILRLNKVRTTLNVSITDSGSERDKTLLVPSALAV